MTTPARTQASQEQAFQKTMAPAILGLYQADSQSPATTPSALASGVPEQLYIGLSERRITDFVFNATDISQDFTRSGAVDVFFDVAIRMTVSGTSPNTLFKFYVYRKRDGESVFTAIDGLCGRTFIASGGATAMVTILDEITLSDGDQLQLWAEVDSNTTVTLEDYSIIVKEAR